MNSIIIKNRKAVTLTQEKIKHTKNAILYVLAGGTLLAFSCFVGRPSPETIIVGAITIPVTTTAILVVLIARYFSLRSDLSALGFKKTGATHTESNPMTVSLTRVAKILLAVACGIAMLGLLVNILIMFTTG